MLTIFLLGKLSFILLFVALTKKSRIPIFFSLALLWSFSNGIVSQSMWRWLEHPWERVKGCVELSEELIESEQSKINIMLVLNTKIATRSIYLE